MTDIAHTEEARRGSTAAPGVVSVFLTTIPVDELGRYRVPHGPDAAGDDLEADSGLVGVDIDVLEVDGFAADGEDPAAELEGYSAGASFAADAAIDLARERRDDHTGLVLVYDHDARLGSGVRDGSGLTLVGVYSYHWHA
jgi:hypothetical protein